MPAVVKLIGPNGATEFVDISEIPVKKAAGYRLPSGGTTYTNNAGVRTIAKDWRDLELGLMGGGGGVGVGEQVTTAAEDTATQQLDNPQTNYRALTGAFKEGLTFGIYEPTEVEKVDIEAKPGYAATGQIASMASPIGAGGITNIAAARLARPLTSPVARMAAEGALDVGLYEGTTAVVTSALRDNPVSGEGIVQHMAVGGGIGGAIGVLGKAGSAIVSRAEAKLARETKLPGGKSLELAKKYRDRDIAWAREVKAKVADPEVQASVTRMEELQAKMDAIIPDIRKAHKHPREAVQNWHTLNEQYSELADQVAAKTATEAVVPDLAATTTALSDSYRWGDDVRGWLDKVPVSEASKPVATAYREFEATRRLVARRLGENVRTPEALEMALRQMPAKKREELAGLLETMAERQGTLKVALDDYGRQVSAAAPPEDVLELTVRRAADRAKVVGDPEKLMASTEEELAVILPTLSKAEAEKLVKRTESLIADEQRGVSKASSEADVSSRRLAEAEATLQTRRSELSMAEKRLREAETGAEQYASASQATSSTRAKTRRERLQASLREAEEEVASVREGLTTKATAKVERTEARIKELSDSLREAKKAAKKNPDAAARVEKLNDLITQTKAILKEAKAEVKAVAKNPRVVKMEETLAKQRAQLAEAESAVEEAVVPKSVAARVVSARRAAEEARSKLSAAEELVAKAKATTTERMGAVGTTATSAGEKLARLKAFKSRLEALDIPTLPNRAVLRGKGLNSARTAQAHAEAATFGTPPELAPATLRGWEKPTSVPRPQPVELLDVKQPDTGVLAWLGDKAGRVSGSVLGDTVLRGWAASSIFGGSAAMGALAAFGPTLAKGIAVGAHHLVTLAPEAVRMVKWVPIVTLTNFGELRDAITSEAMTPGATDAAVGDVADSVGRFSPEHGAEVRAKATAQVMNLYRELPKPPPGMHPKLWNPTVLELVRFDAYAQGVLRPVEVLNGAYHAHPKAIQAVKENYPQIWDSYVQAVHMEAVNNQDKLVSMPLQYRQKLTDTFGVPVSISDTPAYQLRIVSLYREAEMAEQENAGRGMAPRAKDAGSKETTLLDALSKPPGN